MQRKRETRNRLAVIGLLLWASTWPTLATNDVGDPNCAVVDVMQANRLVDVDPGDRFWLTVPVASGWAGVEVHREGDKGWTWLKAGEFLPVQYDEPGEYTIRFRAARARVLEPLLVRVFAPPAGWEGVRGGNGQRQAGGGEALALASSTSGPKFSVGAVYAGRYGTAPSAVVLESLAAIEKGGMTFPRARIKWPLEKMGYTAYADFYAKRQKALTDYIVGRQIWHSLSHGVTDPGGPQGELVGLGFLDGIIRTADIQNLGLNYKLVIADACCSAQTSMGTQQEAQNSDLLTGPAQRFANAWGAKVAYVGWGWEMPAMVAQNWTGKFVENLRFVPELGRGRTVQEARDRFVEQERNNAAKLMKVFGTTGNIIELRTSN